MSSPDASEIVNVARRMSEVAARRPEAVAVVEQLGRDASGKHRYRTVNYREMDDDSSRIAAGLAAMGVRPGTRLALLVRPGIDFITLVFALIKAGTVIVLIDPGMGRRSLVRCLSEAEPEGFVAIPIVHAVRTFLRARFPKARYSVTVGRRWFWGGPTLDDLRRTPATGFQPAATRRDDPAAIIFTSGSTGPPKGVLYTHGVFDAQVEEIRDFYGIREGEVDLACFPLFGLFNGAMGVTAVIPDMDPTRPARVDPRNILDAVRDWNITQSFGSPALWNRVGRYCEEHREVLPTLRRVLSSGAPVSADVLRRMKASIHPDGDMHTPYGATESLPVASIAASEVLGETAAKTREGAGVCVGRRFSRVEWKVVRIVDGPIPTLADAVEPRLGEIGELIVTGPAVTRQYVGRPEANALAKIADGPRIWHRIGDVGYLDNQGRFWFCGRMAHRVLAASGPMYTIPCEAVFNQHPAIARSALVGVGPRGQQRPVMVLEPLPGQFPKTAEARAGLLEEVRRLGQANPLTAAIEDFLLHRAFPVDIRHNAKISREKLALWAAGQLKNP
jgi:acyl-CoA synthetase (AMP-forming)/AMP-acid ligase II